MPSNSYALTPAEMQKIFPLYQRWESEGRPPYMHESFDQPPRKPQYYYDSYHDSIRKGDDGTYRFNVQTSDSAEGDTWVRGTFRVNGGIIEIIEQKAYAT